VSCTGLQKICRTILFNWIQWVADRASRHKREDRKNFRQSIGVLLKLLDWRNVPAETLLGAFVDL
jgi:hypothetical protein